MNHLSPPLCPELLCEIFQWCLPSNCDSLHKLSWINFSHVCSEWRRVSLACPSLWNNVPLSSSPCASVFLKRSKSAPLVLRADLTSCDASILQPLVVANAHRIREFECIGNLTVLAPFLSTLDFMPALEYLLIHPPCDEEILHILHPIPDDQIPAIVQLSEALRRITYRDDSGSSHVSPLKSYTVGFPGVSFDPMPLVSRFGRSHLLTDIDLGGLPISSSSSQDPLSCLSSFPNLWWLTLRSSPDMDAGHSTSPIHLPSLGILALFDLGSASKAAALLDRIIAPRLHDLRVVSRNWLRDEHPWSLLRACRRHIYDHLSPITRAVIKADSEVFQTTDPAQPHPHRTVFQISGFNDEPGLPSLQNFSFVSQAWMGADEVPSAVHLALSAFIPEELGDLTISLKGPKGYDWGVQDVQLWSEAWSMLAYFSDVHTLSLEGEGCITLPDFIFMHDMQLMALGSEKDRRNLPRMLGLKSRDEELDASFGELCLPGLQRLCVEDSACIRGDILLPLAWSRRKAGQPLSLIEFGEKWERSDIALDPSLRALTGMVKMHPWLLPQISFTSSAKKDVEHKKTMGAWDECLQRFKESAPRYIDEVRLCISRGEDPYP